MQDIPLSFDFRGKHLYGVAVPLHNSGMEIPNRFDVIVDKAFLGTLICGKNGWVMDTEQDQQLVETIGAYIHAWYE